LKRYIVAEKGSKQQQRLNITPSISSRLTPKPYTSTHRYANIYSEEAHVLYYNNLMNDEWWIPETSKCMTLYTGQGTLA